MTADPIIQLLNDAAGARVLCIGDLMLDRFVYGDVKRVSPEAPIPILRNAREQEMLGAVGNVARNVASLGGVAVLLGVVGDDAEGRILANLIGAEQNVEGDVLPERGRRTTLKTRFVAGGQQLLRVDAEASALIDPATEADMIAALHGEIEHVGAVLLSDYNKGSVTPAIIKALLSAAKAHGKPVIADPKGRDFSKYGDVAVIKPNASELSEASGLPCDTDADVEAALATGLGQWPAEAILATRSSKGMSFRRRDGAVTHLRAEAQEVFDVSGAGDTSLAAIGLAYAAGADLQLAAELALAASSVAVSKVGTAAVYPDEVRDFRKRGGARLDTTDKIMDLAAAKTQVARWRSASRRIGFTNGCFDILHPGHVSLLKKAKSRCDRLVLGLNSDASVRRLKGPTRPVNDSEARAAVLAALEMIDAVIVFEEDTPQALIEELCPDLLVKGGDYDIEQIVGAPFVQSYGGEVLIAPLVEGVSTTKILETAKSDAS